MKQSILNAAIAIVASLLGVVVGAYMTGRQQMQQLQVQTFEEFDEEFSFKDPELKRIRIKFEHTKKPLTDDERDYYLDFFEDVGLLTNRNLTDFELVDNSLGGYLLEAYNDSGMMKYVKKSRVDDNDPTDYENFEILAVRLQKFDADESAARLKQQP
jgi:hypothetical protein